MRLTVDMHLITMCALQPEFTVCMYAHIHKLYVLHAYNVVIGSMSMADKVSCDFHEKFLDKVLN